MSPAMMLFLGISAASPQASDQPIQAEASRAPGTAPEASKSQGAPVSADKDGGECVFKDARTIIICAQRGQGYGIDPSVTEASREVERTERSANSPTPPAQATCSAQIMGCGKGLASLDLANLALVVGTAAVKAAKGENWARAFKPGAADEYQLYQQAKQRREALEEERAAAKVRMKAREAEQQAAAAHAN